MLVARTRFVRMADDCPLRDAICPRRTLEEAPHGPPVADTPAAVLRGDGRPVRPHLGPYGPTPGARRETGGRSRDAHRRHRDHAEPRGEPQILQAVLRG